MVLAISAHYTTCTVAVHGPEFWGSGWRRISGGRLDTYFEAGPCTPAHHTEMLNFKSWIQNRMTPVIKHVHACACPCTHNMLRKKPGGWDVNSGMWSNGHCCFLLYTFMNFPSFVLWTAIAFQSHTKNYFTRKIKGMQRYSKTKYFFLIL